MSYEILGLMYLMKLNTFYVSNVAQDIFIIHEVAEINSALLQNADRHKFLTCRKIDSYGTGRTEKRNTCLYR